MSAGLPLLILSVLSSLIVAMWVLFGPGPRPQRLTIAVAFFVALALSWALLISFGALHHVGMYAVTCGFLVGLGGLALPLVWRYFFLRNSNT